MKRRIIVLGIIFIVQVFLISVFTGVLQNGIGPHITRLFKSDNYGGKEKKKEKDELEYEKLSRFEKALTEKEKKIKDSEGLIEKEKERLHDEAKKLLSIKNSIEMYEKERINEAADRYKRLARVYENMKAREAALILEKLDRNLASEILKSMKERYAARIMMEMNPLSAAELSKKIGILSEERKKRGDLI